MLWGQGCYFSSNQYSVQSVWLTFFSLILWLQWFSWHFVMLACPKVIFYMQRLYNIGRGGFREERGGRRAPRLPPYFLQSVVVFLAITLKNYELLFGIELVINNVPLTIRLPKYYRNIFNTQSFVIWQTNYILLTQHQL